MSKADAHHLHTLTQSVKTDLNPKKKGIGNPTEIKKTDWPVLPSETPTKEHAEVIVRNLLRKKVPHTNIWKKMKKMGMVSGKEMMELLKTCMKPETEPETKNALTQLRTNSQWWSQNFLWRLHAMKDGYEPHDGRPCSFSKDSNHCIRCGFCSLRSTN